MKKVFIVNAFTLKAEVVTANGSRPIRLREIPSVIRTTFKYAPERNKLEIVFNAIKNNLH